MKPSVKKSGNGYVSYTLNVPSKIAKEIELNQNTELKVSLENNKIIYERENDNMITGAYAAADYVYLNNKGKRVCYHYESKKRVKGKVLDFIKNNKDIELINEFLKQFDLTLKINSTNRYSRRYIIDKQ